jgi:trimeric autotransporter adhesin
MKRNFVVSVFGSLVGFGMLFILLSAAGIVGARSAEVRSDVSRASDVSAATPLTSTFTYQGQLINSGSPVSSACGFQFGLWDSASGLAQIGLTQTVSSVSVSRGLFTALLNTGNEFGDTAFNGDARWLQIAVRCPDSGSYTAMSTRQQLTSLPFALPGLRTFPNATSPNIVGGYSGNFISATVVGSVIGGGGENGYPNRVQASYATVGGGWGNTASGAGAFVGGGGWDGTLFSVGNQATGNVSTIGGGISNLASNYAATVGGGNGNIASGYMATVGGGVGNNAGNQYATVGGGFLNIASGKGAFVGGGGYSGGSFGGNQAIGDASTIGGGIGNTILVTGTSATVGGGYSNNASGGAATVGGGDTNNASAYAATVGGGRYNIASGIGAFVGGGGYDGTNIGSNQATGNVSTIGGGFGNIASGKYAAIPGGYRNTATMTDTFAAGYRANAIHQGAFVWADSTNASFPSTGNDQFLVRANGGVGINTNSPTTNTLTVGGNGLKVGATGTTLALVQSGTATLGIGSPGVNVYTVIFSSTFSATPNVVVTLHGQNYNDVFAVTTRNISTLQFSVNVYRVDNGGNGWSQNLLMDWIAWK